MTTGHLIDGLREFWRSAAAFADDWRRRRAALREVDGLDPHERSRILGEAGLTRRDLDAMRTPFVGDDLLTRAMHAVGAAPAAFRARHGYWHRDMERVCMACPARSRCRRDLATRDFARRYRHYCPNADSLSEVAAGTAREAAARSAGQA